VFRRTVAALALSAGFGAVDARLWHGTNTYWVSNMSSAYLLLAFLVGVLLSRARRSAVLVAGAAATVIALAVFYVLLIHTKDLSTVTAEPRFAHYAVPGVMVGSAFAWLGQRWATRRSWSGPAVLAIALVLEPQAWRQHLGFLPHPATPWHVETAIGLTLALVVTIGELRRRRQIG
jgi:hypothetical protein